ncbi:Hypothetical protein R9X50_00616800 [Acrodontium crateriforme]|uniref:Uncharacterized protein n=1 Tax=Acrodontium crateriforme TaxID=150365 RepID=A0AAQ3R6L1_9PEZI|nr:Hypothetical protein R9X50_00616800 [Acrodontium crateriforme]
MPFRARAKALFRSKKDSDSSSSSDRKESSIYYKPHEMPRPKYRNPPAKEHKEKLESFSFADAWRRKSFQSQYSPMGTRAPSRRNSFMSMHRRKSQRSIHSNLRHSRNNSITSADGDKPSVRQRENIAIPTMGTRLSTEIEADGDDDVGNVGLSRVQSHDFQVHKSQKPSHGSHLTVQDAMIYPQATAGAAREDEYDDDTKTEHEEDKIRSHHDSGAHIIDKTAHDHEPFTEHDLALALQRSHLVVPSAPAIA